MEKEWFGKPMVQCGVMNLNNSHKKGPQFAIACVSIMPVELIKMRSPLHLIIRHFKNLEEAKSEKFSYRKEDVHWKTAKRKGPETVRIAQLMQHTDGVKWLYIRPWGLMALGWNGPTEEYFPTILERMKEVLIEVCGEIEFVDVPNREMFIPKSRQFEAAKDMGILTPFSA